MSKIKPKGGFTRSRTKGQLPSLGLYTPRNTRPHQLSSYLGHISNQISGNVEYDEMDSLKLNKEQRRLKDILRKMNDDTVKIISEYTPRAKKPHNKTTTSMLAVKERQTQNNHAIITLCQTEIQTLKDRSQLLHNHSKEQFQQRIAETVEEIATVQEIIREIKHQNNRRGKSILSEQRIIEEGEIKKMESDVYVLEHRAGRLRSETQRVDDQIHFYSDKLREMAPKHAEADKYSRAIQQTNKEVEHSKTTEQQYFFKKSCLQKLKKKKQFLTQNFHYRYYRGLKQLEEVDNTVKQVQQKIQQSFISIEASQIAISKFQEELKKIKIKKRQRQNNINEFLSQTRMDESRLTSRKMEEDFNGEMPSDIQMHQQGEDTSGIALEKELKYNKTLAESKEETLKDNKPPKEPQDNKNGGNQ